MSAASADCVLARPLLYFHPQGIVHVGLQASFSAQICARIVAAHPWQMPDDVTAALQGCNPYHMPSW